MADDGYTYPIEWGKIREFARATKSTQKDYWENPKAPIPPTFLVTGGFWAPPREAGSGMELPGGRKLDMTRVLHGGTEFTFPDGPPHAGDELVVTSKLESVTEKEGKRGGTMTFVVSLTEYHDKKTGKLVAQSRSTTIETGKAATA